MVMPFTDVILLALCLPQARKRCCEPQRASYEPVPAALGIIWGRISFKYFGGFPISGILADQYTPGLGLELLFAEPI